MVAAPVSFAVVAAVALLAGCAATHHPEGRMGGPDDAIIAPAPRETLPPMETVAPYLVARDPVPEPIRRLQAAGDIAGAEREIDARLAAAAVLAAAAAPDAAPAAAPLDAATREALVVERERLRRMRRDFSLAPEAMLEKLRATIPDATLADLDTWRAEGTLQWLPLDGEVRYFRREPANLYRFGDSARARRDAAAGRPATPATPAGDPSARAGRAFTIDDHAADIVAAMETTDAVGLLPVRLRARHVVTVNPGVVPEGKIIRCWLPYPQEYRQQKDVVLVATDPEAHRIAPNGAAHRTVYFERPAPPPDESASFMVEYEYTIFAYAPRVDPERIRPVDPNDPTLAPYLDEQPPHLLLTPALRALAAEIVGDESNPWRRAERIFHWTSESFRYASEMEYCLMPSVTEKALATGKGDCGIHAILFCALCRAVGVPARWQSGWATRPGNWNLHDWAEFYIPPYGWIPADPSFGLRQRAEDPRVRHFYFGHLDSYRMIANLGFDAPFDPPKTHWRSDPVDNQRGEVEWDEGNLYYDDWRYRVSIEYLEQYREWGE